MFFQGVLGTFPFTVNMAEFASFRDMKRQREFVFAEHKTLCGLPRLQHTGRNLDQLSLAVKLVPLTPMSTVDARLSLLTAMANKGEELPLVLGLSYMGLYALKGYDVTHKNFHCGVTLVADVNLNLQEYN